MPTPRHLPDPSSLNSRRNENTSSTIFIHRAEPLQKQIYLSAIPKNSFKDIKTRVHRTFDIVGVMYDNNRDASVKWASAQLSV